MKRTCPINPACTFLRPWACRGDARASCIETQVIRLMHPEAWARWVAEDDRAFALEAEMDAAFTLPAPEVLVAARSFDPAPATSAPRPPPPGQIPALANRLQERIAALSRAGLRPMAIAAALELWPQTVRRVLHRLAGRAA